MTDVVGGLRADAACGLGERQLIDARVAEMAADGITFGQPGLLRDRVREAFLATRQKFGLAGDGRPPSWRAAMRTLDQRMTLEFLAALGT